MDLDWLGAGVGIGIAVAGSRWLVPWLAQRHGLRPDEMREVMPVRSSGNVLTDLLNSDGSRYERVALGAGFGIAFGISVLSRIVTTDGEIVSAFTAAPGVVLLAFAIPDSILCFAGPHRWEDTRMARSLFRLGLGTGFIVLGDADANLDWVGAGLGIAIAVAGSRWLVPWLARRYGLRPDEVRGPALVASSGDVLQDLRQVPRSGFARFNDSRHERASFAIGFGIGLGIAVASRGVTPEGNLVASFSTAPGAVLLLFAIPDTALSLARPHIRPDIRMGRSLFRLGLAVGFMAIGFFVGAMSPAGSPLG